LAADGGISIKKRRNEPKREKSKREIHRLIISEGLSPTEISLQLNIPKRSVERYLHEIYEEDAFTLLRPTIADVMQSASVYQERINKQRKDILNMAKDSSVDPQYRLEAHQLAAGLEKIIRFLSFAAPLQVAENLRLDINQLRQLVHTKGLDIQLLKHTAIPLSMEEREAQLEEQTQQQLQQ
jgi:hypothetical protein